MILSIDAAAQTSRLNAVNPALKFFSALGLMLVCVAGGPFAGVFLAAMGLALTVFVGGMKLRVYLRFLCVPLSFIIIGALALLFDVRRVPFGAVRLPLFGAWLCVGEGAVRAAALVVARALGALSCLYFVSLTTPMPELIGVLRKARCPELIIELMYLIYRFIFIMTSMIHIMNDAAKSRLGDIKFRTHLRTVGLLYANLLARGYQQARRNFDAMESRCYVDKVLFLQTKLPIKFIHIIIAAAVTAAAIALAVVA